MPSRILVIGFIVPFIFNHPSYSQEDSEAIAEEVMDEWDNKEIELEQAERQEEWEAAAVKRRNNNNSIVSEKTYRAPKNKKREKNSGNSKQNSTFKESTPITRPILYRYIYVNPNAERLKAEARRKQEEHKKAASGAKK